MLTQRKLLLVLVFIIFFITPPIAFLIIAAILYITSKIYKKYIEIKAQNKVLPENPYFDKKFYHKSREWRIIKTKILLRDRYKCQSCYSTIHLDIHHIHYRTLGKETGEELITLCRTCHEKLHEKLGYAWNREYPIK